MDGLAFVQMIEAELAKRGIPKERFYKDSGISSATMSQWRKHIYSPSSAAIKKIEDYLGIVFSIEQKEKAPTVSGEQGVIDQDNHSGIIYQKLLLLTDEQRKLIEHLVDCFAEGNQ